MQNAPELLPWQRAWRAAASLLSDEGLAALRQALITDDPRLIQGMTTSPPPLACVTDWPPPKPPAPSATASGRATG